MFSVHNDPIVHGTDAKSFRTSWALGVGDLAAIGGVEKDFAHRTGRKSDFSGYRDNSVLAGKVELVDSTDDIGFFGDNHEAGVRATSFFSISIWGFPAEIFPVRSLAALGFGRAFGDQFSLEIREIDEDVSKKPPGG